MSLLASQSPTYFTNIPCGDGNNNGWGGNFGEWILVFLLASMFGWGGMGGFGMGGMGCMGMMWPWMAMNGFGGWGNCGGGNCATQADLAAGFNNSAVLSSLNDLKLGQAGVQQTMCQGFNGVNTAVLTGVNTIENAICDLGYRNQQGINDISRQIGDFCCTTGRAIDGVRYDMAVQACETRHQASDNTRDIIDANNSGIRAILEKLGQIEYNNLSDKYQAVVAENQNLKQNAFFAATIDASQATLLRRLGAECPQPAYMVQPPTPINFQTDGCGNVVFGGYGNNCGCRRCA
jgi:hypothetical protein